MQNDLVNNDYPGLATYVWNFWASTMHTYNYYVLSRIIVYVLLSRIIIIAKFYAGLF